MILTLIVHEQETINIIYPTLDYQSWCSLFDCRSDNDAIKILDQLLKDLDCRKEYNGQRVCMTNWPKYEIRLSKYLYYILKIKNQFIYNEYINKLVSCHNTNIIFEHRYPYNIPIASSRKRKTKNNKKNVRRILSHDLFTGDVVDITGNNHTHKLKKSKIKVDVNVVPLEHMMFSFKKKNYE